MTRNPLNYTLGVAGVNQIHSLRFNPDYALSLEGPRYIPNRTRAFLLHITSNSYKVLKET